MKVAILVVLSLFLTVLLLAPLSSEATDQQSKMKACNEQANAKGLGEGKGEERQAFMKECLSAKPAKSGTTAQQEKMKVCNKEAGEKKLAGDERKKFMSSCLSS